MGENKLAVETGLRGEIVDSFMSGLRNLFSEHYIDIPEGKEDVVEDLASQVEELTAALNKEIETSVELRTENENLVREMILAEAVDGLTDVQAEKLVKLAETVAFDDSDTFGQKVQALRESYFPTGRKAAVKSVLTESLDNDPIENTDDKVSGQMASYVAALSRISKKA
jgi:regulator of replication initiation timing